MSDRRVGHHERTGHHMSNTKAQAAPKALRNGMLLLIVVLAFVASYQIAGAANNGGDTVAGGGDTPGLIPALNGGASADGSSPACACCGNSGSGETVEGAAVVEGDVQRITVDASNGYNPNVIKLAAGIPAEITFGQGSGCMAQVLSKDFGFFEDLTAGPQTVRIEGNALQPGEYTFSCGMEMVFGTIIVE
ncbi:hypothetical protein EG831_07280 [bacterium]|nr:hypothetical protein [bacterium]